MDRAVYEFISNQMKEPISERRMCPWSGEEFPVYQKEKEMLKQLSFSIGAYMLELPLPIYSSQIRLLQRMMFRNERKLYKRTCSATDKRIVSIYPPSYEGSVVTSEYRWSDERDPMDYGFVYDDTETFTEQFKRLYDAVPKICTSILESENCDYTNSTGNSKDCYMSFRCHVSEKALYCYRSNTTQSCVDCYQAKKSEYLYNCVECFKCQRSQFLVNCTDCHSSAFLWNCHGCHDCFLCANMTNAQYCFRNEQYDKETYRQKVAAYNLGSYQQLEACKILFMEMIEQTPRVALDMTGSEHSLGNSLVNCYDCFFTFVTTESEHMIYAWDNMSFTSCMDTYSGGKSELSYQITGTGSSYRCISTLRMKGCKRCLYSAFCFYCEDCFGCVGLQNKQYCIFNKQYTQQEYERIVPQIIESMKKTGEWGNYFSHTISPFPYNDTVAFEYYQPDVISLEDPEAFITGAQLRFGGDACAMSWRTYDKEVDIPAGADTLQADALPDDITEVDDEILKKVLICSVSGRPYRIIPLELAFYRTVGLPLPRVHPELRHAMRKQLIPESDMYVRTCDKTGKEILSIYPADVPFEVYSQETYEKEVYG